MIKVSKEFRDTMRTRRDFREYADITLASGTVLNLEAKDFTVSNNSITDGAGASALPLGEAVEKSIQIEIMNDNDQFSEYDFFGAKIKLYLKFQLSHSVETVNKGTYTVVTPETYGTVISIIAVDDMYKADKTYDSSLSYPATAGEILRDACQKCGIPLLKTTFPNSTKEVTTRPEDVTYRQVIGYCAMFAAGNARIDVNGYLNIISYDFSPFEDLEGLDGGVFDENTPYSSGDSANGGSFNPWNSGTSYDGGTFGDRDDIHILYSFKDLSLDTDDVVITGVQIELDDDLYVSGNEGYMFSVENPLFSGMEKEMTNYLGTRLIGLRMRKFSGDHVSDPTIEAYDLAYIIDRKQNAYQTIITDVDFSVFGWTTISNSAASTIRNSSKYYSNISKAIVEARKNTEEQISDYDLAVQQLTSIMANSMGMFTTSEQTENGGYIVYQHNKPTLEESDIIWKKTEAGFTVSTDGGKTWNAGMDAQGNAVVNVLSAIGISFSWARGGTLTLGGNNNTNGRLRLLDASGAEVGQLSNSGINFLKGIIKLGSLFEVDNAGNVVANSLKSSNAQITGGYLRVTSDNSGSIISISNKDSDDYSSFDYDGFEVMSNPSGSSSNPFTHLIIHSDGITTRRNSKNNILISWDEGDPSILLLSSVNNNSIQMSTNGTTFGTEVSFGRDVDIVGDLFVIGTKSRVSKTDYYGNRLLYCYETPSPIFGDIGEANIDENGICIIPFDGIFLEAINSDCEYHVFLQKEGEGDLWVEKKTAQYFIVKGTAGLKFAWEVKAKQKGYEFERLESYREPENDIIDYEYQGQSIYESYTNSKEELE